MASYVENLIKRRDKVAAELAALEKSKPNYSIDGEAVQHHSNRLAMIQELKELEELIMSADGIAYFETEGF